MGVVILCIHFFVSLFCISLSFWVCLVYGEESISLTYSWEGKERKGKGSPLVSFIMDLNIVMDNISTGRF